MKKLLLLISIIIAFSCVNATREQKTSDITQKTNSENETNKTIILLSNGKFGNIRIGERIDSVLLKLSKEFIVRKDSVPSCEGCTEYSPIYTVHNCKSNFVLFTIEPDWNQESNDKLFRVRVYSDEFETERGIRVGMTIKNLKTKYEIVEVDIGGETGIHIIVKDLKGSFGIELPNDNNWWALTKETIPDSLKIIEIIMV